MILFPSLVSLLHRFRAAGDCHHAGSRNIHQPQGPHQPDKGIDFCRRTRHLEHEGGMRRVDHAGAEGIAQPQRLDALLTRAGNLDERHSRSTDVVSMVRSTTL